MLLDDKFFDHLSVILKEMGKDHYLDQVEKEKLSYLSPEIRIGMWGQFSSGKSSLVNALIGRDILPSNICETTAKVTEIAYGEFLQIIINPYAENKIFPYSKALAVIVLTKKNNFHELRDGLKDGITEDEFLEALKLIGPFENKIDSVLIKVPCEILKSGMIFVDLPGLKGSEEKQAETIEKIKDCEIVLWLKSEDRPTDKHDWEVINMLKAEGSRRVAFAIKTKSDEMFKTRYSEDNGIHKKEEDIYLDFKQEFKKEIQNAMFDDIFLVSPIAYRAMLDSKGNNTEACNILREKDENKNKHRNKFRFLKEGANVSVISGYHYFEKEFFAAIDAKRAEAKYRKSKGSILLLESKVREEINEFAKELNRSTKMDHEEHQKHSIELNRIKESYEKLKDVRSSLRKNLDSSLSRFVNNHYQHWIKEAFCLCSLDENTYVNVNHVTDSISANLIIVATSKMKEPVIQKEINGILVDCLGGFKRDVFEVEQMIREFSSKLFNENASDDLTSLVSSSGDFNYSLKENHSKGLDADSLFGVAGGVAGGLILDTSLDFMLDGVMGFLGGFGIGTALRGAWNGSQNGDGIAVGIENSFLNMRDGMASLIGKIPLFSDVGKKSEVRLILRRLATSGERESFSQSIYAATYEKFGAGLKNNLIDELFGKIEKSKVIEMIGMRLKSQEINLQNLYDNKSIELKDKSLKIERLKTLRQNYVKVITEYGLVTPIKPHGKISA